MSIIPLELFLIIGQYVNDITYLSLKRVSKDMNYYIKNREREAKFKLIFNDKFLIHIKRLEEAKIIFSFSQAMRDTYKTYHSFQDILDYLYVESDITEINDIKNLYQGNYIKLLDNFNTKYDSKDSNIITRHRKIYMIDC